MVKYRINLTKEEVSKLTSIIDKGSHSSQTLRAAHVLLNCDEGEYSHGKSTNEEISRVLKIVHLACSSPPEGFARWSMRLLAGKVVELGYVDSLSHVSVYKALKKTISSLGKQCAFSTRNA